MRFRAGGLTIAAPRPIPGFKSCGAARADITVATTATPPWVNSSFHLCHRSDNTDALGTPNLMVVRASEGFRLAYADDTIFWIAKDGRRIWMTWATTFEDACTYLTGPVLAFVLRLHGALALHASAVQIGHHALALVGPHGAGKSTTAAALGRRGCPVIADDVLRLTRGREGWLAQADGSVLRLWPRASQLLFGDADRLPRMTASWDKRALRLGQYGIRSASRPVTLSGLVFLDGSGVGPDPVVSVDAAAALLRLVANSAATHLLDTSQRAAEFPALGTLARSVPSAVAFVPHDTLDTTRLCDQLIEWASAGARRTDT